MKPQIAFFMTQNSSVLFKNIDSDSQLKSNKSRKLFNNDNYSRKLVKSNVNTELAIQDSKLGLGFTKVEIIIGPPDDISIRFGPFERLLFANRERKR